VDAHQSGCGVNVSHHQCDCLFRTPVTVAAKFTPETKDTESAPAGGEVSGGNLSNHGTHNIIIAS
jgi:hypothetical protein